MDILEIDAASNRGIDEIRDLREKVRLSPVSARYKVYIIDEVHMLTTEAFNALLKTLEEPPAHALFILCTTESHKVPATIFSRCFHVQFTLATPEELMRSFRRIALGEKLQIDDDALATIASLADGSFRDGAKVLEEVALMAQKGKITKALIEEKYKISSIDAHLSSMLAFLNEKDTKGALGLVATLTSQGVDSKYFIMQLVARLHSNLLQQLGVEEGVAKPQFSLEAIQSLVELLSKAFVETKYAVIPQLPLEMAIIAWGAAQNQELPARNASQRDAGGRIKNQELKNEKLQEEAAASAEGSGPASTSSAETSEPKGKVSDATFWKEFVEKVNGENRSLAGVLRGCRLQRYDGKRLIIETSYTFHKERLDEAKALSVLEKVGKEIAGNLITISVKLKS